MKQKNFKLEDCKFCKKKFKKAITSSNGGHTSHDMILKRMNAKFCSKECSRNYYVIWHKGYHHAYRKYKGVK